MHVAAGLPSGAAAVLLVLALLLALVNGMHDASNAVSTSIATRSLSERGALTMAALLNLLGAAAGIGMATWTLRGLVATLGLAEPGHAAIRRSLVDPDQARILLALLVTGTVVTIAWELLTWWWGMPSSTLHAFLGCMVGGAAALGFSPPWGRSSLLIAAPILLSPVLGGLLTYALVHAIAQTTARRGLRTRHLRGAQTLSAGAVAAGHGLMDVRLPLALATAAILLAGGGGAGGGNAPAADGVCAVPWWLAALLPLALAAGTLLGGRRVIRTLGRRLTDLSTAQGLAAEASAALILCIATLGLGIPVSTTHTVTAGIVGAGWAVGPRSVRWSVVARIGVTWLVTPVICAAATAGTMLLLR